MTKWKNRERRILAREILGLLVITVIVAFVLMQALSVCAVAIAERYLFLQEITLTDAQLVKLDEGVFHLSLLVSVGFFVILFLFLLGERLSYGRRAPHQT